MGKEELAKTKELRHRLEATKNKLNAARVSFLLEEARTGLQLARLALNSKDGTDIESLLRQRSSALDALQVILHFSPLVDLKDPERDELESLVSELRSCLAQL